MVHQMSHFEFSHHQVVEAAIVTHMVVFTLAQHVQARHPRGLQWQPLRGSTLRKVHSVLWIALSLVVLMITPTAPATSAPTAEPQYTGTTKYGYPLPAVCESGDMAEVEATISREV